MEILHASKIRGRGLHDGNLVLLLKARIRIEHINSARKRYIIVVYEYAMEVAFRNIAFVFLFVFVYASALRAASGYGSVWESDHGEGFSCLFY